MGTGGASWLCSCADAAACHLLPASHPTAFSRFPSAYYCLLAEEYSCSVYSAIMCSRLHTQHKRYTEGNLNEGMIKLYQCGRDLTFLRDPTRGRRCPAGHCC